MKAFLQQKLWTVLLNNYQESQKNQLKEPSEMYSESDKFTQEYMARITISLLIIIILLLIMILIGIYQIVKVNENLAV